MDILTKKQTESLIKKSKILSVSIEYNGNHFTMKIVGVIVKKQSEKVE